MYHVPMAVQCVYGWSDEGGENGDGQEGSELHGGWERVRLPGLLYADDLVLCSKSEEDLRVMVGWFAEVRRGRGLKVNAGKSKVMVQNGEEGLECEVHVGWVRLEHVSEFKDLGYVLDKLGIDGAECSRKVVSGRRVAGARKRLTQQ